MKVKFDWGAIEKELWSKETISDKLDYLASINETVTGPLWNERHNLLPSTRRGNPLSDIQKKRLEELDDIFFGEYDGITSDFNVPAIFIERLADKYRTDPEYTFWFIKSRAKLIFDIKIDAKAFKEKISSPLAANFIKAELNRLNALEARAKELFEDNKIDTHARNIPAPYKREIEFLRLEEGYYKNNVCEESYFGANTPVDVYCDHWILKPYLQNKADNLNITPLFIEGDSNSTKPELTQEELALKLIYNNEHLLSRESAKQVAIKNGHESGNSLYNFISHYKSRSNRIGVEKDDLSLKKTRNKADRIEKVILHLSGAAKERAVSELQTLNASIKNDLG